MEIISTLTRKSLPLKFKPAILEIKDKKENIQKINHLVYLKWKREIPNVFFFFCLNWIYFLSYKRVHV